MGQAIVSTPREAHPENEGHVYAPAGPPPGDEEARELTGAAIRDVVLRERQLGQLGRAGGRGEHGVHEHSRPLHAQGVAGQLQRPQRRGRARGGRRRGEERGAERAHALHLDEVVAEIERVQVRERVLLESGRQRLGALVPDALLGRDGLMMWVD